MSVPKIIMQIWHDWSKSSAKEASSSDDPSSDDNPLSTVPKKWLDSPRSIKEKLPDYQYVLLTNENSRQFVTEHFPEYLETYDNLPYPIQRVDMLRPMWLYVYGGVYMDMDNEILKDFSEFFKSGDLFFVSSINTRMFIHNDFMASRPKHPFWLAYLEHMKQPAPWYAFSKHFEVLTTTGTIALAHVLQNTKTTFTLLPQKFVSPCSMCDEKCSEAITGYIRPLGGQSWNGWDSVILNFLVCKWNYILFFIVLCILAWLVWRWKHPPPKMCVC
jgi:mannosyltransferase OCH1-like enzyme